MEEFKRMGERKEPEEECEDDVDDEAAAEVEVEAEDADDVGDDDGDEAKAVKESSKVAKKKKKDGLALGKHYYVFVVQSVTTNGTPVRFIAARYCVANMSHRWLRSKIEFIESALAFYGFIVCAESFDGATENRSYIKNRMTKTFRELCSLYLRKNPLDLEIAEYCAKLHRLGDRPHEETAGDFPSVNEPTESVATNEEPTESRAANDESNNAEEDSVLASSEEEEEDDEEEEEVEMEVDGGESRLYSEDDLPWDLLIAFDHPSVIGVIIVAAGDMGHGLKKMRNAMDLSGKEDKARDLHLNGLPINLRMAYDVWKLTPDGDPNQLSEIMIYPKLKMSVFYPTSKSAMRTADAARAQGNSMMEMLHDFGSRNPKAGPSTYDAMMMHCLNTDHWVDVMNANISKGCGIISSPEHPHIYDLCDYVKYLTQWKNSVSDSNLFFPNSTYEDVCWTSLGPVVLARYYLPNNPTHNINQMRLGSDVCESSFNMKRNANPNANKRDTDNIFATIHGSIIMQMAASRKGNVGKKRVYFGKELLVGKIKRDSTRRRRTK